MLYLGGDDYHPLQHTSYQNLRVEEIAAILRISQPSVSSRLKRGRDKLRDRLEGGSPRE
ncbi:MAG: sigma-70 family RNA polymerase sigma factor [Clostridia bacterium]|nr:sigma-70 family RNA polymerase sigma factor [Clostridia bacterium]